ncbi:MAG: hypothetical protein P4L81_00785 [Candidatus Pacebacteria bacterium]|nr:hypothetical protein [Candidatus Paceibacterota bacterium]
MNDTEPTLSLTSSILLIVIGLIADIAKAVLDFFFVGFILDPFVITPITAIVFGMILDQNGISMFSGKRWVAGWVNLVFSLIPVLDWLPDWTAYAVYLAIKYR